MPINFLKRWCKRFLLLILVALLTFMVIRIYDSQRGLRLEVWHRYVPNEMTAAEIDKMTFADYLKAEEGIFQEVIDNVIKPLEQGQTLTVADIDGLNEDFDFDDQNVSETDWDDYFSTNRTIINSLGSNGVPLNRYLEQSAVYPGNFEQDWNRSYVMMPDTSLYPTPKGAVVLLHGLTDTPYSLRNMADLYRSNGFVAIGLRLPAHGTVPAALSKVDWEDWLAATRLGVREAKRLTSEKSPLHIVGFSNGGALAMKYALDAIDNDSLAKPDHVVLISPMIGITAFARFAGIAGWPAVFPPFAKAAWLSVLPEFNPFKYNSFPVNGARQSHLLTSVLQQQISDYAQQGKLTSLPPVITFQSVVDFTVSTRAVITALYNQLPDNGSELVLFDLNRAANFDILMRSSTISNVGQLLPAPPRKYDSTIVTNREKFNSEVVARTQRALTNEEIVEPLGVSYPNDFFSLSHVAIPFAANDPLYGSQPSNPTQYGINLGSLAVRGERSVLLVDLDTLLRASSNPFYDYMMQRVQSDIDKSLK
ncbi:alpha/beta hydrolase [Thorsellia anophelis]|uniref:Alpha/beta hydrolase family protein n=1 Tax=Thorsellia anophelis DSM 18579 TaxID=1123402 RepID=A0A1I0DPZ7_9GAMM|nr:alpha/beta hydrolase [Thorsellia anophelis]SET34471.1 Alpha/beta hydrolase family protein [Thorsellia anophelis DSM 18579]